MLALSMPSKSLACLGLFLALCLLPPGLPSAASQTAARDYEFLRSLYPRSEGSPGEKAALLYIEKRLGELSLPSSRFDFRDAETFHSFSACLEVSVAGRGGTP